MNVLHALQQLTRIGIKQGNNRHGSLETINMERIYDLSMELTDSAMQTWKQEKRKWCALKLCD
jgi:hypothetical protein